MFLWVTQVRKLSKFGSRYLGEELLEWDKILHIARGAVDVPHYPDQLHLAQGGPSGEPKYCKGVKNFCNAFLQGGFTDLDEIWLDGGRL